MAKVRVYSFKKFEITSGESKRSSYYATEEAIKRFGGVRDEASAIDIDEEMLDGEGRYKPKGD